MGQFTITPRAIKDEKGNWLVAIDIESTDKELKNIEATKQAIKEVVREVLKELKANQ